MATLKIWETVRAANAMPLVRLDERTTYQTVAFTGTAGVSNAFDGDTTVISVVADANAAIRVGAAPTAVATDFQIDANVRQDFAVEPGQKISVIAR